MLRPRLIAPAVLVLSAVAGALLPASSASAASFSLRVDAPMTGRIGVDAIYAGGGGGGAYDIGTCSLKGEPTLGWDSNGRLVGTTTVPDSLPGLGTLEKIRLEMYPGECGHYSPWKYDVGGVHVESAPGARDLGTISLPVAGQGGAFRIDGAILSSTPVADGRVAVDTFQVPTAYPDPEAPLQQNGSAEWGAFASGSNNGMAWTGGVGWSGRYILFVTDRAAGRSVSAIVDITPLNIPTIDLDAICFGLDTCQYGEGGPATASGSFHPTSPTRIVDTRAGVGIGNGPVRTGGGRHESPDPLTRRDEIANHEVKVTGTGGIPESGVSAVLLNVTAIEAPATGYLAVTPKPPACCGGMSIYDDQATLISGEPATSSLNVAAGDTVPNLVLARVGAGGKIRIFNWWGPTNVVVDLAGWFGTGGAHTDGAGFAGVTPTRLLDTRNGLGGPQRAFDAFETRTLKVAGVAGVPADATSVVVNITATNVAGSGFLTAFPTGGAVPTASNLNYRGGDTRANLAVVQVGASGEIALFAAESSVDLIVDVMGSFGPYGGHVTAIEPRRLVDSRVALRAGPGHLGEQQVVTIPVRGVEGVPADASAVVLNVTATDTTGFGYLTVFPSDAATPNASNVNFNAPGQNVPNMVMVKLGADGAVNVLNGVAAANLIIDVTGYVI
jgi:hypothetical protein